MPSERKSEEVKPLSVDKKNTSANNVVPKKDYPQNRTKHKAGAQQKYQERSTQNKSNTKKEQKSGTLKKGLDNSQKLVILGVSILVLFLVLYLAGVFESKKVEQPIGNTTQTGNLNNGASLDNMQHLQHLEQQLSNDPNNNDLRLELANLQLDSKLLDAAISNYKLYLKNVPDNNDARVDLGICYFEKSEYNDAIAEMEKVVKKDPSHQKAMLNLGVVNLNAGNTAKAKEWFKKAMDVNPNSETGLTAKQLLNSH